MNLFSLSLVDIEQFLMVLFRISGVIIYAPFFGSRNVPVKVRIFLCLLVSILIFPNLRGILPDTATSSLILLPIRMIMEILIGLSIGLIALIVFAGAQLAGQMVGMQMGFGIVNVIDPYTGSQISIIGQLQNIITMWFFIIINGHHWFLQGIADSFHIIPLGDARISEGLVMNLLFLASDAFIIGVKIGAPGIITLLIVSLMMGIIAKTVPQINILIVGFPVKVAAGLLSIGLAFNLMYIVLEKYFFKLYEQIYTIFKLFAS